MRKTVAKVVYRGTYRVIFDTQAFIKPYTIYYESYDVDCDFHSRKIESHGDLAMCLAHIIDIINH